jgi:hypothetical protein
MNGSRDIRGRRVEIGISRSRRSASDPPPDRSEIYNVAGADEEAVVFVVEREALFAVYRRIPENRLKADEESLAFFGRVKGVGKGVPRRNVLAIWSGA